jgi:hypothetical protein
MARATSDSADLGFAGNGYAVGMPAKKKKATKAPPRKKAPARKAVKAKAPKTKRPKARAPKTKAARVVSRPPQGTAPSPASYIAALPAPHRAEVARIHELIRKTVPSLAPSVALGMIGYGAYHYRYASGREGDSFRVGVASRANGISVYVAAFEDGAYVAERMAKELGKVRVGRSCVRFKRVDDLDLGAFIRLLQKAATSGVTGESQTR